MWEKAFVGSRCGPSCDNESGLIEDRLPTGAENINFAVFLNIQLQIQFTCNMAFQNDLY